MASLRTQLIRLAHQNPELRAALVPLLRTAEEHTELFIRFGKWRASEQSFNSQTEKFEKGVSVFKVLGMIPSVDWDPDKQIYVPRKRLGFDVRKMDRRETYLGPQVHATLHGVAHAVMESKSPIFLVEGTVVGKGGDKEPVLKNLSIVKKLKLDDVTDNMGELDKILFRGRRDMRPLLKKKSTPYDETLWFWDGKTIQSTSKWDVEDPWKEDDAA